MPIFIAYEAGDIHLLKRNLAGKLERHHNHPSNPEEDDVEPGNEHVGWVELVKELGFVRPAQCRESPQCRGEPRVEHVFVLSENDVVTKPMCSTNASLVGAYIDLVVFVIPRGNTVSPPKLTADTPVLNIAHPSEIGVFPIFRNELNIAVLDCFNSRVCERLYCHIPLVCEVGLDNYAAAIAARHLQFVRFDFLKQAKRLDIGDYLLTCLEAVEAAVGLWCLVVNARLFGQYIDDLEVMAFAYLVVIKIVCGGNLHTACAKFGVYIVIGNDGYAAAAQG